MIGAVGAAVAVIAVVVALWERSRLGREVAALNQRCLAAQGEVDQVRGAWLQARDEAARLALEVARSDERARRLADLEQELKAQHEVVRIGAEQLREAREALVREQSLAQSRQEMALAREADQQRSLVLLEDRFKALAAEILEEKSRRFAEQNQASLSQLLTPLHERIRDFKTKVEEVYQVEGRERSTLAEHVRQLATLNQTLSEEAKNLTAALKGSARAQGSWGELILERVLESAGLRKGHEYQVQESHTRDDGSRAQPDVIIDLPEGRRLIVDAKVSLTAYERYASADDEAIRAAELRAHLDSVRAHVRGLSERRYQEIAPGRSLDFVLAFVPIEPAFMLAVTHDADLFMDAWNRNVLLVSPSTLLFVVRTVAHLWRQEAQSRNAQEIARRGAELFDKLHGFVSDLDEIGNRLEQAQRSYTAARSKFVSGRGNLIRQAQMLRELGVKPSKEFSPAQLHQAQAEETPRGDALAAPQGPAQGAAIQDD